MNLSKHLSGQNIALVSVFAGFIAASTLWGGVDIVAGVPITLQTFAVMLAGAVLGPWRGASAVIIYLVLGTAGLPIFAGHTNGAIAWPSATAGFLIGFIPAAFVTGWIVRGLRRNNSLSFIGIFGAAVMGGIVVLYPIGWGYVAWKAGLDFQATFIAAVPFAFLDLIKCVFVGLVAAAVHRAYPWVLGAATTAKPASAAPAETTDANETVTTA